MNFSPLFIVALGAAFIFWLNRLHIRNLFQAFVKSPVRKSSQAKLSDSVSRLALAASRNDFIEFAATLEDGGENLALEYMVTGPPSLEFLQELTVRYPLNALASYLLGCRLLAEAWKSRAGKRVSQTKQEVICNLGLGICLFKPICLFSSQHPLVGNSRKSGEIRKAHLVGNQDSYFDM
jgi:hypothetical protein